VLSNSKTWTLGDDIYEEESEGTAHELKASLLTFRDESTVNRSVCLPVKK